MYFVIQKTKQNVFPYQVVTSKQHYEEQYFRQITWNTLDTKI
jgi:hypothetical protein